MFPFKCSQPSDQDWGQLNQGSILLSMKSEPDQLQAGSITIGDSSVANELLNSPKCI